ncbi:MAG TPA: ABC transporter permease [Longimicrobiales bacterium]|nr:ABC transporter permease [Longimicrobiales bacterium]
MDTLLLDLRYGLRSLARSRGFTAAALLCLSLGIGLNTGIYTIVNAILLRPLPIANADRVVSIFWTDYSRHIDDGGIAFGDLEDFRATGLFERLEAVRERGVTLTSPDGAQRVDAVAVTPGVFALLGARPALGRDFRAEDAAPQGLEQAVILSHGLWQREFGGDRDVLGRKIALDGRALTVVGVMPDGFRFPERQDLWLPLGAADPTTRAGRLLWGLGTLRPGVSVEAAAAQISDVGVRIAASDATLQRDLKATLLPFRDSVVDALARRMLLVLLGAVAFVLLIASANVANLMLARAADRRRELAIRLALGASRRHIVRQLLTESVVLALISAGLGLLIARWWIDASLRLIPEDLAYWMRFDIDTPVLLYTLALALGTVLLFGLAPALQSTRADLHDDLKQSARAGEPRARARLRGALIVAEVGLSLVLLVGAALTVQSFLRMQRADVGFRTDRVLTMRALLAAERYADPAARTEIWQRAAERVRALPGVAGAAVTSAIPADDGGPSTRAVAAGSDLPASDGALVMLFASTTGYFDALGLELLAGRDFRPEEVRDTGAAVAVVGQRLARELWPGADPTGRTIVLADGAVLRVIGVAPDLQYDEFGEDVIGTRLQLHVPAGRFGWRGMSLIVRAEADAAALVPGIRRELSALEPLLAPYEIMTFDERRIFTQWHVRLMGSYFASFGLMALVLALAGVFGVVAYAIARRQHEIGVRLALGASPRGTVWLMVWQTARLSLIGIALGLLGALAVSRALHGMLFGIEATDPRTLLALPVLLAAAAVLAAWLPARRAARVDPLVTLRAE